MADRLGGNQVGCTSERFLTGARNDILRGIGCHLASPPPTVSHFVIPILRSRRGICMKRRLLNWLKGYAQQAYTELILSFASSREKNERHEAHCPSSSRAKPASARPMRLRRDKRSRQTRTPITAPPMTSAMLWTGKTKVPGRIRTA
jgi:hypothetical protein